MNTELNSSLDSLLDINLSDVADLPEFVTPPNGSYLATIESVTLEEKKGSGAGKPAYLNCTVKYVLEATLELADAADTQVKDGSTASESYNLSNAEFGMPKFKKIMQAISEATGASSVRQTIDAMKGFQVIINVKNRKDKKDPTIKYFSVDSLMLP